MKRKSKVILLFIIISIFIIYIKTINPYLQKSKIGSDLKDKWNISIDSRDRLIAFAKNKPDWHREQQKFILFETENHNRLSKSNKKIDYDTLERIKEIEDVLGVKKEDRINFASDYDYKTYTIEKYTRSSEQKNDLLYHIKVNENDKSRIFIIEDLNVLDLERSKF